MSSLSISELNELAKKLNIEEHGHIREMYLLNNWYRYKSNLNELDYTEMQNLKTLFKGLKELSAADREVLAIKYDRKLKRPTDEEIAAELGMSKITYGKKRRQIQRKLKHIIIKQKLEDSKK